MTLSTIAGISARKREADVRRGVTLCHNEEGDMYTEIRENQSGEGKVCSPQREYTGSAGEIVLHI